MILELFPARSRRYNSLAHMMDNSAPTHAPETERSDIGTVDTTPLASDDSWVKHEKYYFEMVIFQVEDTLFRVPKNSFLKADPDSIFPTMFSLPPSDEMISEGEHDSHPIVLEGVPKAYFEGFLLVMYPFKRTAVTFEEWIGALDLATMWSFSEIRGKAISALTDMLVERDPLQNLLLARKYQVRSWLKESILRLVKNQALELRTLQRGGSLDWETIARIFAVQARLMRRGSLLKPEIEVERMFYGELREMSEPQDVSHRSAAQCQPLPVAYPEYTTTGQVAVAPSEGTTGPSRHSIYYMEDITTLVAGTLFRIPKGELLQPGATFGEIYGLLQEMEGQPQLPSSNGLGVRCPITLEGVSEEYFVGFLDALYPLGKSSTSFADGIGALDLATRWKFDGIRAKSIATLTPVIQNGSPTQSVVLGKKYSVKEWLFDGYLRLVNQPSLNYPDLRHPFELDWQCITKILQIRYTILSSERRPSNNPFENTNFADVEVSRFTR
ncbi:unnamed protein product [Cyclocybe aegerita]|uniref:BTB domain-containing protein n=1 Tax=Cyclocybe aegerita TaxID=1973307 RepID=A0A8S0W7N5_CYCAE|nr:unnamed protein product [Cyclocybe aegerita]